MTFPDILDLNSFIDGAESELAASVSGGSVAGGTPQAANTPDKPSGGDKVDDASTTDSGSALDVEDSSVDNTSTSQPESDNQVITFLISYISHRSAVAVFCVYILIKNKLEYP